MIIISSSEAARRAALRRFRGGAALLAGLVATGAAVAGTATAPDADAAGPRAATSQARAWTGTKRLPVKQIERTLQADGHVSSSGVLEVDIDRKDLHVTGGRPRVRFEDGFQIQHELYFQSLGHGKAILNGDLALRPQEIQPVIDAFIAHGLTFQAQHQHLYDLRPMVWFLHFRAIGDPVRMAGAARAVIGKTSTPLPQHSPPHPTTPLPERRLAKILGGDATVGENGIVTVTVPRTDRIRLGGVLVDPDLGVSTSVQFQPLGKGKAAVVPDFSMTAKETQPVISVMRRRHWQVGCLYNQETAEFPQLYFSHMFRVGDPVALARQVRAGLDRTHVKHS
ncbi:DUF1259 domain-containing protein [Actinomadura verrucosospora]|uniref:Lipoprotein LpqO n=1 Tax=Actinomadura verrucosospora TaxID=46165 RepID=A0A7D4ANZ8_ACTVE|nr:DUF1259 domain-containing protein [Actinomadura verrucosospora]QKG21569.1 lipoprotein LpqO [Actinomadura verrucosospora]